MDESYEQGYRNVTYIRFRCHGSISAASSTRGNRPKKSTEVDVENSSRVESRSFSAVDPPSNVNLKSDFTPTLCVGPIHTI